MRGGGQDGRKSTGYNLIKGKFFPLQTLAPSFDPSSTQIGAPVSGVTVNPARIREEHKPSEWLLKHIPAHLPDLALGQRWAKCFYSDGLRQDNRVPRKVFNREALQGLLVQDAVVGRKVVSVTCASAYSRSKDVRMQLETLLLRKAELSTRLSATVPWETTDHQDVRRQWENILKEESFLQKTLSRVEAEISSGVIVATEGKARLPDGAISVQWKNGHVFRYYHSLDGGTRYPLAHAPIAASTPLHLGETKPEKGSWTLVLGLNAFAKPGEADRQQEAERHRDIVKRCLKNMTYTIVMKCFRKLKSYRKPASFCLITLQKLESEDNFYEPGIQDVFQGCVAEKRQEDWMAELCSNATDPSWIEARKKEEEEKENENRRKIVYMKKLGLKANQVKLKAESPFPPSTGTAVTGTPATVKSSWAYMGNSRNSTPLSKSEANASKQTSPLCTPARRAEERQHYASNTLHALAKSKPGTPAVHV